MRALSLRLASAVGFVLGACRGQDCVALPCALPVAVIVTVTDGAGGPAPSGSVVHVSGAIVAAFACSSGMCAVPGTAGTYTLAVGAPGFQSVQRTVTVQGTSPECGCPSVETARVAVALIPQAASISR
jgi:hypothetical protein